jgi:hypothetical protein
MPPRKSVPPPCTCSCHVKVSPPETMTKWMLIQEIQKYGKLKYATYRNHDELTAILKELREQNGRCDKVIPKSVVNVKTSFIDPPRSLTICSSSSRVQS